MRIRSIKPEFWGSEDVAQLPYFDRLLFVGLWSYVHDNGVGRDNVKLIVAALFPLDEDPAQVIELVDKGMATIAAAGMVDRYVVAGRPYFHVRKWTKHQVINRPTRSVYPLPPNGHGGESQEGSVSNHGAFTEPSVKAQSTDQGSGSMEHGSGSMESGVSLVSKLQTVEVNGKKLTIDEKAAKRISELTGGPASHIVAVCKDILDRAPGPVRSPGAFIIRSIEAEPGRYKFARRAPKKSEQCPKHPGQYADRCNACAADRLAEPPEGGDDA